MIKKNRKQLANKNIKRKSRSSRRGRKYYGGAGDELVTTSTLRPSMLDVDSSEDELVIGMPSLEKETPKKFDFNELKKLEQTPPNIPRIKLEPTLPREPTLASREIATGTDLSMMKKDDANEAAKTLREINEKIDNMKKDMKSEQDITGTITRLKTQLKQIVSRLQELKNNNDEKTKRIEQEKQQLMSRKDEQQKLLVELQGRVKTQVALVNQLKDKNLSSEDKIENDRLKHELNATKASLETTRKQLKNLQANQEKNNNEFSGQVGHLKKIKAELDVLNTSIGNQSEAIDTGFETFDEQVGMLDSVTKAFEGVGTTINQFFGMGGGKKGKKSPKLKFMKLKRSSLERLGKKWGMKNTKKYRTKTHLLVALTLLLVYKTRGKVFIKKDLIVLAKNLDIKVDKKMTKKDLSLLINKRTRRFALKDLK